MDRLVVLLEFQNIQRHVEWILQATEESERFETLVDSFDIRSLNERLARVARVTGLDVEVTA
jgi:hypothetical protein